MSKKQDYYDWYWDTYFMFCETSSTYKEAWERTEQVHEEKHGWCRFDTYESFRTNKQKAFSPRRPLVDPNQLVLFVEE